MSEIPVCFKIERLCKTFSNGFTAINGISLELYEGFTTVIAGANGSGKTLLMRIITGLSDAGSGSVFFRGVPLERALPDVRKNVGMVFQDADAQIIGETVVEDVRFGPSNLGFSKAQIDDSASCAIKLMGLENKKDFSPSSLSGGEKRRLAIAGILSMGCGIVIMDEPFSNLDYTGVRQTLSAIKQLQDTNKTIIILTHELEKVIGMANRLVIMHGGRIAEDGLPEDVLNRLKPEYAIRDPRIVYSGLKDCSWLTN
jgi:biotin transport system ATP-binding protein